MNYQKRIICLANSRKMSGRCVAGKELSDVGIGNWVRPVSNRSTQEISLEERRYSDGSEVAILDIVDIPILKAVPYYYQTENHLIDADDYWMRIGVFPSNQIEILCDKVGPLWINGDHSYHGFNDRLHEKGAIGLFDRE